MFARQVLRMRLGLFAWNSKAGARTSKRRSNGWRKPASKWNQWKLTSSKAEAASRLSLRSSFVLSNFGARTDSALDRRIVSPYIPYQEDQKPSPMTKRDLVS